MIWDPERIILSPQSLIFKTIISLWSLKISILMPELNNYSLYYTVAALSYPENEAKSQGLQLMAKENLKEK